MEFTEQRVMLSVSDIYLTNSELRNLPREARKEIEKILEGREKDIIDQIEFTKNDLKHVYGHNHFTFKMNDIHDFKEETNDKVILAFTVLYENGKTDLKWGFFDKDAYYIKSVYFFTAREGGIITLSRKDYIKREGGIWVKEAITIRCFINFLRNKVVRNMWGEDLHPWLGQLYTKNMIDDFIFSRRDNLNLYSHNYYLVADNENEIPEEDFFIDQGWG